MVREVVTGTYTAVNQQTGKCLDVNAPSTADGAAVQQWTCITGAQNQQFTLQPRQQSSPPNQTWRLWGF